MLTTAEFLALVLPDEGLRCIALAPPSDEAHKDVSWQQFYFTTNERAAEKVAELDEVCPPGWSIFFACATFKVRKRNVENVEAVRSLWMDLDVGPGKPHATQLAAFTALVTFCQAEGIPIPWIVKSGRGLHCYWLFDRLLDVGTWTSIARGFKAAAVERLGADKAPWHAAAVLRPVGSHHRKREPVPVVAGRVPDPVDPAIFDRWRVAVTGTDLTALKGLTFNQRILGALNYDRPEQSDLDIVRNRCLQLRSFATPGNQISQPDWFASLRTLAHVVGGRDQALVWSQHWGDGDDDEAGAEAAFERASAYAPAQCTDFSAEGCAGCLYRGLVRTPLDTEFVSPRGNDAIVEAARRATAQFGVGEIEAPARAEPEELAGEAEDQGHEGGGDPEGQRTADPFFWQNQTDVSGRTLDWHPHGYENRSGALLLALPGKVVDGEQRPPNYVKVATPEIRLHGVAQAERASSRQYEIQRRHPKSGVWEVMDLETSKMVGSGFEAYLADRGINLHNIIFFRRWLRESADYQESVRGTMTAYENYGWKEDFREFVYGERVYRDGRFDRAVLAQSLRGRAKFLAPKRGASREGWISAAKQIVFRPGFEPIAFAALASLSAPIMKMMHGSEGGTIVSLVSTDTAHGKSTSLAGAASIWAHDKRGVGKKTDDTKVSAGVILGQMGNLPVIHDELYSDDAREMYAAIQQFQAGEDRNRGTVDGGLRAQENTWQTVMVSASNDSLVGAVEARQGSDAMAYRVVEFRVKSTKTVMSDVAVERYAQNLFEHGAVVGHCFLEFLTRPEVMAYVKNPVMIEKTRLRWNELGFDKRHRFWTRLLTAMDFTMRLMKASGILPDVDFEDCLKWGIEQMRINMETGLEAKSPEKQAKELLVSFIMAHQGFQTYEADRAWVLNQAEAIPYPEVRDPVIRRNKDTGEVFIHRNRLRQWLQMKHNTQLGPFLRTLKEQGIVTHPDSERNLMAGTKQSSGSVPCVIVNGVHAAMGGPRPRPKLELVPKGPDNDDRSKRPGNGARPS